MVHSSDRQTRRFSVRGEGRVAVAAFGLADAEHLVEKEITRLWSGVTVTVTDIARPDASRVVEEVVVHYKVEGPVDVAREDADRDDTHRYAFRAARSLLAGSRYAGTAWVKAMRSNEEET